jgi:hypothetical protein
LSPAPPIPPPKEAFISAEGRFLEMSQTRQEGAMFSVRTKQVFSAHEASKEPPVASLTEFDDE